MPNSFEDAGSRRSLIQYEIFYVKLHVTIFRRKAKRAADVTVTVFSGFVSAAVYYEAESATRRD